MPVSRPRYPIRLAPGHRLRVGSGPPKGGAVPRTVSVILVVGQRTTTFLLRRFTQVRILPTRLPDPYGPMDTTPAF